MVENRANAQHQRGLEMAYFIARILQEGRTSEAQNNFEDEKHGYTSQLSFGSCGVTLTCLQGLGINDELLQDKLGIPDEQQLSQIISKLKPLIGEKAIEKIERGLAPPLIEQARMGLLK
ncbi:MAG: hypothetical protein WBD86_00485 [Microgenomates group bacterium]